MKKKDRKYLYLSNLDSSGTVFQTQILDWLNQYRDNGLSFELIQAFHIKDLKRPKYLKRQLTELKKSASYYTGSVYLFPSKSLLYIVNAFIIYFKILRDLFQYREVLIFSRAIIGKEIKFLRKISPAKVIFYFDARAAAAEENKYVAALKRDFTLSRYVIIANTYYIVYQTLLAADKIFVVSNVLQKYFQDTYNLVKKKFVAYPCLADAKKFYFNDSIRNELRSSLGIEEGTKVFIYSGGIDGEWHITEKLFTFFDHLSKQKKEVLLICLIKKQASLDKILHNYPGLKKHFMSFSVPNNEVFKYLNAADYGILFRENTIMNNVASPTKFAEYMLCGLPVLISEGVGDYSDYTTANNLGVLIKENELKDPEEFDFNAFMVKKFDRTHITNIGEKNFSKESAINTIVSELKS